MPLLSNMELIGIEHGKEIGALQNARNAVTTVLKTRFGEISSDIVDYLGQISDLSLLNEMLKLAVTVNFLEDFKQSLENL
jgi:hypothetical protein